jgi:YegS/Rv2252/BmrU family lipid kinase
MTDNTNILFVINPISGSIDKSDTEHRLKKTAQNMGFTHGVYRTSGENDLVTLKESIDYQKPDIVVAVGGDGTCNLVGTVVQGMKVKMGIMPFGSANGMARALNIPNNLEASLNIIHRGKTKTIDMLKVNDRYAMHLSDVGLNARIIRKFEKNKQRGLWSYGKQFFKELFSIQSHKYKLMLNEDTFVKKALMIVMANANKYGTGAIINPHGRLDDGIFELIIIKPYRSVGFLKIVRAFFNGNYENINFVEIYEAKKARIINFHKQTLQVDGEISGKPKIIELEIVPQCIDVIVP